MFQQKLLEKSTVFIVKMTGPAMVRPASSDFWKAPLVSGKNLSVDEKKENQWINLAQKDLFSTYTLQNHSQYFKCQDSTIEMNNEKETKLISKWSHSRRQALI